MSDIPKCPTCGQLLPVRVSDFSIGDRVYHTTREQEGEIVAIDNDGLHIRFGDDVTPSAVFNDEWFRVTMKNNNGRPLLRKATP